MIKLVVLASLMAAASAGVLAPIAPITPLVYSAPLFWNDNNYRGPLSLAPGQPASILSSDGRPLDTLEVNQDRAARIANTYGVHVLKKRSAPLIAPLSTSYAVAHSSLIAPGARLTYAAPFTTAHVAPITYNVPLVHW